MIYKLSHKMYIHLKSKHRRDVKDEQKPRGLLVRRLDQVNPLHYALETLCPVKQRLHRPYCGSGEVRVCSISDRFFAKLMLR